MNPILGMRAPARPAPRKHLLPAEVALLLRTAAEQIGHAEMALAADWTTAFAGRVCSWRSRLVCSFVLPLTPGRGAGSWQRCAWATWPVAC